MNIMKGIISRPVKGCVYGVEGIGKSTFAGKWPDPLFLDLDGGTSRLDVNRVSDIQSWPQLMEDVKEVYSNPSLCRTLVIDTADAAERLCIEYICGKYGKKGIEDFGYGSGYTYLVEEFSRLLVLLETCIAQGINVCILAHAILKTVTLPDEMGQYDHWELKLSSKTTNKVAPLVKEWADLLLFANYETILITDDASKKQKAQGGKRVMWTTHTTFADAKNRFDLTDKLPFDYSYIAKCIPDANKLLTESIPAARDEFAKKEPAEKPFKKTVEASAEPEPVSTQENAPGAQVLANRPALAKVYALMKQGNIPEEDIVRAVSMKGYFPPNMKISDYPDDFIDGVLVGAWDQIKSFIKENMNVQF